MDYSFPKERRLRKRADYLLMREKSLGRAMVGGFLVVIRPNAGPLTRFGVTVTRKIGRAVVRNRLKRQAREFFRLNRGQWPEGLDLLFIATQKALTNWPPEPFEVARLTKLTPRLLSSYASSEKDPKISVSLKVQIAAKSPAKAASDQFN
ncbi:MAG: ribonuclease P protein component [Deltaproteobacteria bacterium]|nr:ribonuclease P protein component [Deltaproteobacteria bacterium]